LGGADPEHAHPGVMLWGWVSCHLDRGRLSRGRVLVRFEYPTLSGPGSRGWLLIERADAVICEKHPGGEEDLVVVVSDPVAFARWDLGELEWGDRGAGFTRAGAGASHLETPRRSGPAPACREAGNHSRLGPQARGQHHARVQTLHFLCGPGDSTIEAARVLHRTAE
jgi:hypothetical protein